MKNQSSVRPALTEKLQGATLVNFNIIEVEGGFEFDTVKVSEEPTYSEVIEAIITSSYSTGREFACINNKEEKPDEYTAYQLFRETAKDIAKQVLYK